MEKIGGYDINSNLLKEQASRNLVSSVLRILLSEGKYIQFDFWFDLNEVGLFGFDWLIFVNLNPGRNYQS